MQTRLIGPIALIVIGIVVMSISGSDKMFLAGGAVLIALAGIGLMIVDNKPSNAISKTDSGT